MTHSGSHRLTQRRHRQLQREAPLPPRTCPPDPGRELRAWTGLTAGTSLCQRGQGGACAAPGSCCPAPGGASGHCHRPPRAGHAPPGEDREGGGLMLLGVGCGSKRLSVAKPLGPRRCLRSGCAGSTHLGTLRRSQGAGGSREGHPSCRGGAALAQVPRQPSSFHLCAFSSA